MRLQKLCFTFALSSLSFGSYALANTIDITSTALPTLTLGASSDTLTLNASHVSVAAPGTITFQAGSFYLGNSPIADQLIPFSFRDTITLNGITKTLTFYGSDNVTSALDTFSISAAAPVSFGSYNFALNGLSFDAAAIGVNTPVNLTAIVTPAAVPEPATLALLVTGLIGGIAARSARSPLAAG